MNKNIDYERITNLLVESMENVMYGPDSLDGHESTKEEIDLQIKKAETLAKLGEAVMEVRRTEQEEKKITFEFLKTFVKSGEISLEDIQNIGLIKPLALEDRSVK